MANIDDILPSAKDCLKKSAEMEAEKAAEAFLADSLQSPGLDTEPAIRAQACHEVSDRRRGRNASGLIDQVPGGIDPARHGPRPGEGGVRSGRPLDTDRDPPKSRGPGGAAIPVEAVGGQDQALEQALQVDTGEAGEVQGKVRQTGRRVVDRRAQPGGGGAVQRRRPGSRKQGRRIPWNKQDFPAPRPTAKTQPCRVQCRWKGRVSTHGNAGYGVGGCAAA